ncbi:MAG: acyloxyacyl hydrolase [Nitrospiraceae bacterium]|nr:acyloxyacyl hydrolase [Nitrospiraceae bacterium]
MRCNQRARFLLLINMLGFTAGLCATPSYAGDITLVSIGPRIGFGEKIPFMGKEQKYYFHLYDVAATIKRPWSWPLGESTWSVDTRLLTSAGLLTGGNESGLIMTAVPVLALSGWKGLLTLDAGVGAGLFSNHTFGVQDFGGPVQIVATLGAQVSPFSHTYAGVRIQHFSDAGLNGSSSLGVDMYIAELGYRF